MAGFLTANPAYQELFPEILHALLSRDAYAPERIELGGTDFEKVIEFDPTLERELSTMWKSAPDPSVWHLESDRVVHLSITLVKTSLPFAPLNLRIERGYFVSYERVAEFIEVLKQFYNLLRPAFGSSELREMFRPYDDPLLGKVVPGIDLEHGLPNTGWLIALGPEYVDMFGEGRVKSAPCHSIESLDDGGVLLLLSSSPLDYLRDPKEFDERRNRLKSHLGIEAFDTGEPSFRGKIPRFRFFEKRSKELASGTPTGFVRQSSSLSALNQDEWKTWIQNNHSIALDFVRVMSLRGVKLDFSERSLEALDEYIDRSKKTDVLNSVEFFTKMAAYVAQIIIRNTGAAWSFRGSKDIPSLWLGDVQISPLARAQKVILEDETFERWYQFITGTLLSAEKSGDAGRR